MPWLINGFGTGYGAPSHDPAVIKIKLRTNVPGVYTHEVCAFGERDGRGGEERGHFLTFAHLLRNSIGFVFDLQLIDQIELKVDYQRQPKE